MNTNTIPAVINNTLDVLSARFGTTGATLWRALTGYARFNACMWMLCGAGSFGILLWMISRWEPDDNDIYFLKYLGMGACIIAMALFIAGNIADIVYPQAAVIVWIAGGAK